MSIEHYRNRVLVKGSDNKSRIKSEKKRAFDDYLKSTPNSDNVIIDGVEYLAVIQDKTFNNEMSEDKFLLTSIDTPTIVGSIVEWDNAKWIINSKENETIKSQQSHKMIKCNDILTYQNPNTLEITTIPCVLTDKSSVYNDGLKTGTIILQDDQIAIKVPFDKEIAKFSLKKRFIFQHSVVYELTQVDPLTEKGLIKLTMKRTQESSLHDNFELNIADYIETIIEPEPPAPTEIVISGSGTITLNQTNTYTVDSVDSILFYLKSDDGNDTNLAQITEQSNNVCKVKASGVSSNVGKYFRLYATNGVNENYVRIMVKSLF